MYEPAREALWREVQKMSFMDRWLHPFMWKVGAVDGRMTLEPIYTPEQKRLLDLRDQYLKEVADYLGLGENDERFPEETARSWFRRVYLQSF